MMTLEVSREDVAQVAERLEAMRHTIDHFSRVEMGDVMSDWQTNDMNRHRPFTMRSRHKVQTVVRPHSLREMLGLREYDRQLRRYLHIKVGRLPRPKHPHMVRRWSTRPILRAALESKLFSDMTEAFHSAISWSK